MPLTDKQQRFVEEYLVDLNGAAAYRRAGYKASTEKVSTVEASRLLAKPSIASAVIAAQQARSRRTAVTADAVVREIARVAFSDIRKLYRPDGTLLLPHEWDDDTAACVAAVETVEAVLQTDETTQVVTTSRKVKSWNKLDALGKLVKHLGLEAPVKYDLTVTVEERRSRLDSLLDALRQRAGVGRAGVPADGRAAGDN